ncbi:flavodoxin family protein, partial [Thermodesulfobacteriota bacterium]
SVKHRAKLSCVGILFGTPVYFINVSAQAKAIIDRTYCLMRKGGLRGKVVASIIAVRRVGAGQVTSLLYTFYMAQRMKPAGSGIGYGRDKGEVREGVGGSPVFSALEEARAVGRNVVRMVKRLSG